MTTHNLGIYSKITKGNSVYILCALLFLSIKLLTWGGGYLFATHGDTQFNAANYLYNFHHIRVDTRMSGSKAGDFFTLWNYADGEWYLSIARDGYPSTDQIRRDIWNNYGYHSTEQESFRRYAFLPLFPGVVALFAQLFDVEASAFLTICIINVLAAVAFLYLFRLYFPERKEYVIWPFLLTFLFPFSVFYSLYFPECLFLLLSICVFIFMKQKKFFLMGLSGFLLSLTRPNGMFITIPVIFGLLPLAWDGTRTVKGKTIPFLSALIIPIGFLLYLCFGYIQTGDWNFYSTAVKSGWGTDFSMTKAHILNKLVLIMRFFSLPLHTFHASKIDTFLLLFFLVAISLMWLDRKFPRELTLWSTVLWIAPFLATTDLMSYSRYVVVSFPVFLFLGLRKGWIKYLLIVFFAIGYFYALRAVIRYDWVG